MVLLSEMLQLLSKHSAIVFQALSLYVGKGIGNVQGLV